MSEERQLNEQDLEDGTLLKAAVYAFAQERTQENLIRILMLLRDSYVWIPCNAILANRDQEFLKNMLESTSDDPASLVGKEFSNQEAIRLVPDILQNGDKYFFPAFSGIEEMGEYGQHFSKVQKHFLEAAILARNNEKSVEGIVINAFSEPLVVPWSLIEIIEKMPSAFVSEEETEHA